MARLVVDDDHVVVAMNPAERAMALRRKVRVPLAAVTEVFVAESPYDEVIEKDVRMGFAAKSAPGSRLVCVGPPAHTADGQAMMIVYMNRPSVIVRVDPDTSDGWALLVVSMEDPAATVDAIEDARG